MPVIGYARHDGTAVPTSQVGGKGDAPKRTHSGRGFMTDRRPYEPTSAPTSAPKVGPKPERPDAVPDGRNKPLCAFPSGKCVRSAPTSRPPTPGRFQAWAQRKIVSQRPTKRTHLDMPRRR